MSNQNLLPIGKGLLAGLAATIVLSVLMVLKAQAGLLPQLDLPKMLAGMVGSPDTPMLGWAVHFFIGIVLYGVAMAVLDARHPGQSSVAHALLIAFVGWLIMMIVLMPMAGAGWFGIHLGIMAAVMTLVLHLVFGAVLGWTYVRLMHPGHGEHAHGAAPLS